MNFFKRQEVEGSAEGAQTHQKQELNVFDEAKKFREILVQINNAHSLVELNQLHVELQQIHAQDQEIKRSIAEAIERQRSILISPLLLAMKDKIESVTKLADLPSLEDIRLGFARLGMRAEEIEEIMTDEINNRHSQQQYRLKLQ